MKPWQLAVVTVTTAAFVWLADYAYHQAHPDIDHGYSKADQDKMSKLLDKPRPVNLMVYLFADDGQPVDQHIKFTEWARARKTLGK